MNQRQTEIFKVIMECGSITAAAHALLISQPAVTKTLRALEQELGLLLFKRTPRGLVPTREARALYTEVERTFISLEYLNRFAQDLRLMKHSRLVVSAIPALSIRWLPTVAAKFLADYPDASLSFEAWSSPHTAQLVGEGRVDLGLAQSRTRDPTLTRIPIFAVEVVCVLPRGHPLEAEPVITPAHLQKQQFISLSAQDVIRVQLERLLDEHGIAINRHLEVSMGMTLCQVVNEGFGIGIVDGETAAHQVLGNIVVRPFRPLIEMPVFLLRVTRKPTSIVEDKFVEYITANPILPRETASFSVDDTR